MLAELKDLVQKSLFTQVRRAEASLVQLAQIHVSRRVGGGETDLEKTDSVRNCSCASGRKEE